MSTRHKFNSSLTRHRPKQNKTNDHSIWKREKKTHREIIKQKENCQFCPRETGLKQKNIKILSVFVTQGRRGFKQEGGRVSIESGVAGVLNKNTWILFLSFLSVLCLSSFENQLDLISFFFSFSWFIPPMFLGFVCVCVCCFFYFLDAPPGNWKQKPKIEFKIELTHDEERRCAERTEWFSFNY